VITVERKSVFIGPLWEDFPFNCAAERFFDMDPRPGISLFRDREYRFLV
jgi:hypothetical protein